MANTITTIYQDDVISIDDNDVVLNTTIMNGAVGSGYVTGGGVGGAGASTYSWTGAGAGSTWSTTYGTGAYTIASTTGNVGIGSTQFNGSFTVSTKSKITLDVENERAILGTEKSKIDIDELAEMITLMKSLLVAVASDEEFAKRNPALAEAAHDMLINKLKG